MTNEETKLFANLTARVADLEEWRRTALGYPIWKAGDTFLPGFTAGYLGKLWTSVVMTKQEPGTGDEWAPFTPGLSMASGSVAH